MSILNSLGYVVVRGPIDKWTRFATEMLGAQAEVSASGDLNVRLDDRAYRIIVEDGSADGPQSLVGMGFTVSDANALDELSTRLASYDVESQVDDNLRLRRGVEGLRLFSDPDGNMIEAVHGIPAANTPFTSPAGVDFVTGELGVGHVFMTGSSNPDEMAKWYREVLGFRLTDTIALKALQSDDDAYFLHCNARHHSIAVARSPMLPPGLGHVMLEVSDFPTLGRMMTTAQDAAGDIVITLGEHSNDKMTSYYLTTPSGFDIEYGCNGLLVDDETWQLAHYEALSNWGHRYVGPIH